MKTFIWLFIGVIVLGLVGFVFFLSKSPKETRQKTSENIQIQEESNKQSASELKIEEIVLGEGKEAARGSILTVHYTGTLLDGTKFDSSLDRGRPFQFVLGAGQVIKGWEQGFSGMKVGGKRKLTIPPNLAYGSVPGHPLGQETLVFEVELIEVAER